MRRRVEYLAREPWAVGIMTFAISTGCCRSSLFRSALSSRAGYGPGDLFSWRQDRPRSRLAGRDVGTTCYDASDGHVWHQMRVMAAAIGGGLSSVPDAQMGFFEGGISRYGATIFRNSQ